MKKRFFTLFALIISLLMNLNAQEYLPILKQGRSWSCVDTYGQSMGNVPRPFTITVCGDSILNGKKMFKLSIVYEKLEGWNNPEDRYELAYEENGKVWKYSGTGEYTQYDLMIDMELKKGYKIDNSTTILDVDTIEVNGIHRRRIYLDDRWSEGKMTKVYWVEGIGANSNLWAYGNGYCTGGGYDYLLACYDDGELIFSNEDFDAPATNGISGIKTEKKKKDEIFDISGKRISTTQQGGGIYISNGRKYVDKGK